MGDTGASNVVGFFIIACAFVLAPILAILVGVLFRSRSNARKALIFFAVILLLPCILIIGIVLFSNLKGTYEQYVESKKFYEERQHVFAVNNITYRLPPNNTSSLELLPDGTYVFWGVPVEFTEKDGILTINKKEVLHVKAGDVVSINEEGHGSILPPSSKIKHE